MRTTQKDRLLKITTTLEYDHLLIKRIRSREALSQLFSFEVDLLHEEDAPGTEPTLIDPQQVLGQPMTVTAKQNDGTIRFFNGICVSFTQGNRNDRFSKYHAELMPRFWFLTQNVQSRIFQNISVPDIISKVFTGFEFDMEVQGTFEPRNYCVQYRESDWDFASRLMEEEGIYYYFEHSESSHRMIIANTDGSHRPCPGKSEIPFVNDASMLDDHWTGMIQTWHSADRLRTGKFMLRDHNFQLPKNTLETTQLSRFSIGGNQKMEVYDFPGGYSKRFDGIDSGGGEQPANLQKVFTDRQRTTDIRQQELDVNYKSGYATADCCSLTAGYKFQLNAHPVDANNRFHILVNVQTEAVQTPSYVSDDIVANAYLVNFASIAQGAGQAPFRPARRTPKPIVHGSQTAVVVGPDGEEIFTDKYGRVKVQFFWDREGKANASSSCWLRVATSIAGNKWGSIFIPRIGMEVLVDFLEGDPDQPIIVGSVYNAGAMPPYTLPDEKTKSTTKTNSSKGGGGFNELRFEDKRGEEQIFIHGQKNEDIRIKNDAMEWIGNDRHLIVIHDQFEKVRADKHLTVEGDHNEKITGTMSVNAGSNMQEKVGSNYALEAGSEVHIKAGMTAVIEAGVSLTLKVGGNFININPAGIFIKGTMVMLNSGGAAGSGSGSSPTSPKVAKEADNAQPGTSPESAQRNSPPPAKTFGPGAAAMQGAAASGAPFV
ncbi:MAG: type VI secretion system tip protein TssI/VgrG [Acidobacteriota bacterium]